MRYAAASRARPLACNHANTSAKCQIDALPSCTGAGKLPGCASISYTYVEPTIFDCPRQAMTLPRQTAPISVRQNSSGLPLALAGSGMGSAGFTRSWRTPPGVVVDGLPRQ